MAAQEDWQQVSYSIEAQDLDAQPVNLTNTARAPPATNANVTITSTALAQTGNLRALAVGGAQWASVSFGTDLDATKGGVVNHYGPLNEGPLPEKIANTFRGGTYDEVITTEPTKLYRVYGGSAGEMGAYWTRTKPSEPV